MGSDESHFIVSLIVRAKFTGPSPQTTIFEERGELKQIRTEDPLLTSLAPYRWAKPAHDPTSQPAHLSFLGGGFTPSPHYAGETRRGKVIAK